MFFFLPRLNQQTSAPSGIAKLRESLDDPSTSQSDPMNIDDYIFPSSIASPTGNSPSPPADAATSTSNAMASAIPIKSKKEMQDQSYANFPPSAPPHDRLRNHEFDYVQRRVRKTSIDETRVISHFSDTKGSSTGLTRSSTLGKGLRNFLLKYILPTASSYPTIRRVMPPWAIILSIILDNTLIILYTQPHILMFHITLIPSTCMTTRSSIRPAPSNKTSPSRPPDLPLSRMGHSQRTRTTRWPPR